jgi:hypothetical protein
MGDLPDRFYTLVGRVVVHTTELEELLADLMVLIRYGRPDTSQVPISDGEDEDQEIAAYREMVRQWREKSGSTVVNKLRFQLTNRLPKQYWADVDRFLDACAEALDGRHGVAHSVWIAVSEGLWLGQRYPQPRKGIVNPSPYFNNITATERTLEEQVHRLQSLSHETSVWRERVEGASANQ